MNKEVIHVLKLKVTELPIITNYTSINTYKQLKALQTLETQLFGFVNHPLPIFIERKLATSTQAMQIINKQKGVRSADFVLITSNLSKQPLGLLVYHKQKGNTIHLAEFGINEKFQHSTLGTQVLANFINWFKGTDITNIILETRASNENMQHLVKTVGFKEDKTRTYTYNKADIEAGICYKYAYKEG